MILTKADIENCAEEILREYGDDRDAPIDIEWFAGDFLDLHIQYENLSPDGAILGLTTYEDAELSMYGYGARNKGEECVVTVPKNTILISKTLLRVNSHPDLNPFSLGRLRFTIAHECAHQILYRIEPDARKVSCRTVAGRPYSLCELKSRGDFQEWQANALASAILMPTARIAGRLGGRTLWLCGDRLTVSGSMLLEELANEFQASMSSMYFRLKQLGFVQRYRQEEHSFYSGRIDKIVQDENRAAAV